MRRLADIPAGTALDELGQVINDRLRRIEQLFSKADLKNVPAATAGKDAVSLQQLNGLLAGLTAQIQAQINGMTPAAPSDGGTSSATMQSVLSIPGTLAIESDAAAILTFKEAKKVTEVELFVKQPPLAGDLQVRILVDDATAATVTLAAGQTRVRSSVKFSIAATKAVRIDLINVGITFPGADLSVILRFA